MSETAAETTSTDATDTGETTDATVTDQTTETTDTSTDGGEDSRVTRANREAAQYRVKLRETEQALEELRTEQQASAGVLDALRKALTGETEADPGADPAQQVTEMTSRVEALTTENTDLRAALVVHDLAAENGANPKALLDSKGFERTLRGLDPAGDNYHAEVADAIKAAVESNPSLRAAGQVPSRGGAENAGQGAGDGAAVTADEFAAMSYGQKAELFRTNPTLYRQLSGRS